MREAEFSFRSSATIHGSMYSPTQVEVGKNPAGTRWQARRAGIRPLILGLAFGFSIYGRAAQAPSSGTVVAGYVFQQNALLQPGQIDPHGVNRINYAFANVVDGRMVAGFATDAQNIATLTALRKENPSLTVLISVGGWLWSTNFSDAALTEKSRAVFIQSVMGFLKFYDLDGLDVDWEYPGMAGASQNFRNEDKQNFTQLLEELRQRFNEETKRTHKRLYLTIASGAFEEYLAHTEMAKVQRYLDAVNLMAYDYYEPGSDALTGHQAPLFTSPKDPKKASADASVQAFEKAGVPAAKIILGVPFYGHMWGQVAGQNDGLFQPGKPVSGGDASYSQIEGTMLNHGFTRYWDSAASAPYLYSEEKQVFVSYEDPESLAAKCNYVVSHKLGGVMFWSYMNDSSGELLGAIDHSLQQPDSGTAKER